MTGLRLSTATLIPLVNALSAVHDFPGKTWCQKYTEKIRIEEKNEKKQLHLVKKKRVRNGCTAIDVFMDELSSSQKIV